MSKDKTSEKYPPYIPFYYHVFLRLRKFYRQTYVRRAEARARKTGPVGIVDDGEGIWQKGAKPANPSAHINKSAIWMDEDLAQPEIKAITQGIEEIKGQLTEKSLKYTATAASFVPRMYTDYTEKKNAWENAWCCHHADIREGQNILDIGGASTAFNFYLASLGCKVTIIDNDWNNVGIIYNANYVARKMNWDLKALDLDAEKPLPFPDNYFDRVFSICVIEHLTSQGRRTLMKELGRVLKPGGIMAMSTDYDHKREVLIFDRGLRFAYKDKFFKDVVEPSGCSLMGNQDLIDMDPHAQFLGAFFLQKEA